MNEDQLEKRRINSRNYRARNPDKIREANKEYKASNKDKIREYNRSYLKKNREKVYSSNNRLRTEYRKNSPQFKLAENLRSRFRTSLGTNKKETSVIDLIGCSIKQFREHIEAQFLDGMSWGNYGKWHLDHIKPLKAFDLQNPIDQAAAWHYSNFQPLWAFDNLSKGSKY